MTLAILGGEPVIKRPLAKFNTIDNSEIMGAQHVLRHFPLSGFLGGQARGGHLVCELEQEWAKAMGVKHAIACNSGTSGLLAACAAVGVGIGSPVLTTPFTMSATSAAPLFLGANLIYGDIDPETFNLSPFVDAKYLHDVHAVLVTNLFGHPADLYKWREECHKRGVYLIEDSTQTPFSVIGQTGQIYAGTVGDVGVFSFNVHKHLQCGEGGMVVVPDDDRIALAIRHFINHGELAGNGRAGLNLRMTELNAVIALEQLKKRNDIITKRQFQALNLTSIADKYEWIGPPIKRDHCEHVYYAWAAKFTMPFVPRNLLLKAINAEGFPIRTGYVDPLYHLPAFAQFRSPCPVAEAMHDKILGVFENCGYTLNDDDFAGFEQILRKIEDNIPALRGITEATA